ncbi:retrovirus-related Pol polyprotein from type-1 retrotransposable element R2 [Elysia marginata]|uniref:Retrovirus-related Pol polyprotein from type-1 retrotransposable element R2 n=1 Tax=Elysia marginata TaxID=1093978 RepID=A0AAV4JWS4_9GAST|nr:retrovirus-related Pol polyprotein from type-1 retrotransposable element R2 [Elysia marginata]
MNRINPTINKHLDDTQLGFKKGKGTRDGIFLLRNTCERMVDCQKDLNLCFIDYAKAFDRVNHEKLMEILAKAGIPSHEWRLACEIYWNQSAKVKLTSGTTEGIKIQRGVRQGCILSPSLFNLYCEYLLQKAISKKSGILINGFNINNIRYADDTVILAESEKQFQAMLDRIVDKCKEYMAWRSTRRRPRRCTLEGIQRRLHYLTVGNAVLEQVSKCSYLGHMITEDVATLKYKY